MRALVLFKPTDIPPMVSLVVDAIETSFAFRPERLIIPSRIAKRVSVVSIRMGNRSELDPDADSLPGEVFSEASEATFDFSGAELGEKISLTVQNDSNVTVHFRAVMIGKDVGSRGDDRTMVIGKNGHTIGYITGECSMAEKACATIPKERLR